VFELVLSVIERLYACVHVFRHFFAQLCVARACVRACVLAC
jgi:hypothetical protein